MFYSKSTGGFYLPEIHGSNIPADAVEITEAEHAALMEAQAAGKYISGDDTGNPVALLPPGPTTDQIWGRISAERDRRMEDGGYKVGTKWFHSDQKSRSQQLGLVLLSVAMPEDIQWKTMDGSFVPMTSELAQGILVAAATNDQAVFVAAETHKAAMLASADPITYDFSTGWPQTFQEASV
jgi:hypothetical protein